MTRREILERALAQCQAWLWRPVEGHLARHYLCETRAIDERVVHAAGLGYLPGRGPDGHPRFPKHLTTALRESGASDADLTALGFSREMHSRKPGSTDAWLVDKPLGGGYVVLPIREADGAILALKFRKIPDLALEEAPRYDGTSGDMRHALFGWHDAGKTDTVIAVEGELDQLSVATARMVDPAVPPAVALHGKELTPERLAALATRVHHLILALDADAGGRDGILAGRARYQAAGLRVTVLPLPPESDANDLLRALGPEGLAVLLHHAPRLSLTEWHALQLERQAIAEHDPVYAARALRVTAETDPEAPQAAARAARVTALPTSVFTPTPITPGVHL